VPSKRPYTPQPLTNAPQRTAPRAAPASIPLPGDPVADLRFAFEHLIGELMAARAMVDAGDAVELIGLDVRVEDLCREVEGLEPPLARQFAALLDRTINGLESLALLIRDRTPPSLGSQTETFNETQGQPAAINATSDHTTGTTTDRGDLLRQRALAAYGKSPNASE
jgi:hypothetical protein